MTKLLNIQFEKAIRLLSEYFPVSDESSRKPVLFHDIRVGVYLYEHNYSGDLVLAGLLHDALEFSEMTEEILRNEFGENVAKLVLACTKNDSIKDKQEKTDELIQRCVANGEGALIVKAADIMDSFKFYTAVENKDQLEYCVRNAKTIMKYKPNEFTDRIFGELKKWIK